MGLKSLILRIKGDNKGLKTSLKGSEKAVNGFGSTVKKLGGMIAGAFAVTAIVKFGKELFKIGAMAEGIEKAFKNLGDPNLLKNLQRATYGTVSNLDLMQKSVQANNFQIPVEQLGKLFEFAAARAVQTGESVDYLVNSIVIGIGRKSPLILDNLGLSAVMLRQKLDNVGHSGATVGDVAKAVGAIAEDEMKKMGGFIDTAATKVSRLTASWDNLRLSFGKFITENESIRKDLDEWAIFCRFRGKINYVPGINLVLNINS